jgi:hypothetical protein
VAVALASSLLGSGCATGIFDMGRHPSREDAIAECMLEVPAAAVPYAERFADCMQERGWVYRVPASPREVEEVEEIEAE